jgi:hypothetical protein
MVRYFFVDCSFFDPIRITQGNIASLKYYNEGIVSDINTIILYELEVLYYLTWYTIHKIIYKNLNSYKAVNKDIKYLTKSLFKKFQDCSERLSLNAKRETMKHSQYGS